MRNDPTREEVLAAMAAVQATFTHLYLLRHSAEYDVRIVSAFESIDAAYDYLEHWLLGTFPKDA